MLVFDVTIPKSFENLDNWRNEFAIQAQLSNSDTYPFIVIGNKIDQSDQRAITTKTVHNWCANHHDYPYFETSAKDSTNVEAAFQAAAKLAISHNAPEAYDNREAYSVDVASPQEDRPILDKCCS
eukprot:TRINITY_DN1862_c0_g1_i1.p1 TRINITY_DN1862_c0_g1~~TRINITY_DN1862_c0_g1_i1.p1  ORF type:complete len:125 (+),score=19.59 TRINITY_DN1862_c0_g1_i1:552-926(+)